MENRIYVNGVLKSICDDTIFEYRLKTIKNKYGTENVTVKRVLSSKESIKS